MSVNNKNNNNLNLIYSMIKCTFISKQYICLLTQINCVIVKTNVAEYFGSVRYFIFIQGCKKENQF